MAKIDVTDYRVKQGWTDPAGGGTFAEVLPVSRRW